MALRKTSLNAALRIMRIALWDESSRLSGALGTTIHLFAENTPLDMAALPFEAC